MIQELCQGIVKAWGDDLIQSAGARSNAPAANIYASQWHPCKRRMYHDMVDRGSKPAFDADALARMERGKEREADILGRLTRIGKRSEPPFEVVGGQERFEIKGRSGKVLITGKLDARLKCNGSNPILECKTYHPNIIDRIDSQADLQAGRWTRSADMQLLTYLLANNEPWGILMLDRPGLPKLIPISLEDNLDRAERFLSDAEEVITAARPNGFPYSTPDECRKCWCLGRVCNPPLDYGAGASILTDEGLLMDLEDRANLEEYAKQYERLDKSVKEKLRGVETGIAGDFLITGKWGESTKYEIPKEVKEKYAVKDPKGRFTIKIEKIEKTTAMVSA